MCWMKAYEKKLFSHLQQERVDKTVLPNVKNGLGSIAYMKGNPLTKTEITFNVTKNYFLNGVQIPFNALPANLQVPLPCYVFGLMDSYTSYFNSRLQFNNTNPWFVPDNYGYRLSDELAPFDQMLLVGYWDVVNPGWNFPGNSILFNLAPGFGSLTRNNFWRQGIKYLVNWKLTFRPSPNATTAGQYIAITNNAAVDIEDQQSASNNSFNFVTMPDTVFASTPNLIINAANDVAGQISAIMFLSVKEVLGSELFSGDPAYGIYGSTKTNALSPNVVRGDGIFTYVCKTAATLIPGTAVRYQENLYTCEIIIHCNNVPYGTFLSSLASDLITINQLRTFVPLGNINQYINPLVFIQQSLFGKVFADSIDPRMFITNIDPQQQIADIPLDLPIDKSITLGFNLDAFCNQMQMVLFVEKVEPLTYKREKR